MAEHSMGSILLLLLLGMASAITQVSPPASSTSSPWMDTSLCPLTDSLMVCQLKKGMCSPVSTVFSPPGGPVKAITVCANSTGAALGPQFFMSVGLTFLAGAPESLADKASSDPATATAIRRCALNTTGLLNPDLLTLNRTAVSNSLSGAFITSDLGAAVAAAVASCPEPVDYKLTDFIHCLKVACMSNVAVTPFMSEASSLLTGAAAPATAAAALVAAKKPPIAKSASSSAPAGGAFPYAGAAGGASGAGAFPYAGAAGGASGAMAFPYAGAAGGAGAFPYAGAAGGASGAGSFPFAGAAGGASGAGAFPYAGAASGSSGAGAFPYAGSTGAVGSAAGTSSAGSAAGTSSAAGAGAFTYPSSSGGASAPKTT